MTDRDAALGELLERATPPLETYELDWDDVLRRAGTHRRRIALPSRRVGVVLAILAGAVALALTVTTPWDGGPGVVERAQAALVQPPGTVLHVKWTDTWSENTVSTEAWLDSRGRFHGFVNDASTGQRVEIGGSRELRQSVTYDPATNSIGIFLAGQAYALEDPVAALRKQLAEGTAAADGEATIGGRRVKRIRLQLVGLDCKPVVHYLFVDPKTYRPVEYRVIVFGSKGSGPAPNATVTSTRMKLVRRFLTYERLTATPANVRLTDIRAAHPTAKVYRPPPFRVGPGGCRSRP
jgi:hypothetical protein